MSGRERSHLRMHAFTVSLSEKLFPMHISAHDSAAFSLSAIPSQQQQQPFASKFHGAGGTTRQGMHKRWRGLACKYIRQDVQQFAAVSRWPEESTDARLCGRLLVNSAHSSGCVSLVRTQGCQWYIAVCTNRRYPPGHAFWPAGGRSLAALAIAVEPETESRTPKSMHIKTKSQRFNRLLDS